MTNFCDLRSAEQLTRVTIAIVLPIKRKLVLMFLYLAHPMTLPPRWTAGDICAVAPAVNTVALAVLLSHCVGEARAQMRGAYSWQVNISKLNRWKVPMDSPLECYVFDLPHPTYREGFPARSLQVCPPLVVSQLGWAMALRWSSFCPCSSLDFAAGADEILWGP